MQIDFKPMSENDKYLWEKWIDVEHVKNTWFIEGYETSEYIDIKLLGNGFDYPFIILIDKTPIGYIQCCDLYEYKNICSNPRGIFTKEAKGTFCMDLFIAEENCLNKGYGTLIVKSFVKKIFDDFKAKVILIDPATTNKRAIRCYEKAGFQFVKVANDGVTDCYVMKIKKEC